MEGYKEVNSKNLKKNEMYFVKEKNKEPFAAYFDKSESSTFFRFKHITKEPLLVRKNSKFYQPQIIKLNITRKNSYNRNNSKKNKRSRFEFEPTSVHK